MPRVQDAGEAVLVLVNFERGEEAEGPHGERQHRGDGTGVCLQGGGGGGGKGGFQMYRGVKTKCNAL